MEWMKNGGKASSVCQTRKWASEEKKLSLGAGSAQKYYTCGELLGLRVFFEPGAVFYFYGFCNPILSERIESSLER